MGSGEYTVEQHWCNNEQMNRPTYSLLITTGGIDDRAAIEADVLLFRIASNVSVSTGHLALLTLALQQAYSLTAHT